MSEFEPIPEEIPRQSRSAHKDGGSSDRKSKSSDKHAVKEKKSRSSKNRSSKGDSPPSGQSGHGHGRLGSNGSSKSAGKHKSEPLISLTATTEMDMGLSETNNDHGTVLGFILYNILSIRFIFDCCYCSSFLLWVGSQNGECHKAQLLSAPAIIIIYLLLILCCPSSRSVFRSSASLFLHLFFVFRFFYCSFHPLLEKISLIFVAKHRCYLKAEDCNRRQTSNCMLPYLPRCTVRDDVVADL